MSQQPPWGKLISLNPRKFGNHFLQGAVTIGRGPSVTHRVDSVFISGVHCSLFLDDQKTPVLVDLSTNGCFINGKKVVKKAPTPLTHGDEVSFAVSSAARAKRIDSSFAQGFVSYIFQEIPTDVEDPLLEKYEKVRDLGCGSFGEVGLYKNKSSSDFVAVKRMIIKCNPTLLDEIAIMKQVKHPRLASVIDLYMTDDVAYLVMEFAPGGDLIDKMIALKGACLPEDQCRTLFRNLCDGLQYLHSCGILHRDLKPDNILLRSANSVTNIMLTDFGVSRIVNPSTFAKTCVGSLNYMAPEVILRQTDDKGQPLYATEVLTGGYTAAVDIWSAGVILYLILTGGMPFESAEETLAGNCDYTDIPSKSAQDLLKKIFVVDPAQRITLQSIMEHEWLKEPADEPAAQTPPQTPTRSTKRKRVSEPPPVKATVTPRRRTPRKATHR